MESMEPVRTGKVKDVYDNGDSLLFKFSDRISVFDKIIPVTVPDKGASICRTSAFWFETLNSMGIANHFSSLKSDNEMVVKKFRIFEDHGSRFMINYLIPLEFVMRYYVAGSLLDRIKSGKVNFRDLGLSKQPEAGQKLEDPYFEMTTKFEKTDRPLEVSEAMEIGGLDRYEVLEIKELLIRIDNRIQGEVGKRGLIHADGKKELAMGAEREIVVVDTFGTADEDRFWEESDFRGGNILELSKERVRQYYRKSGYHEKLYSAREKGGKEPEIPALPEDMVKDVSSLYRTMYERITGKKW